MRLLRTLAVILVVALLLILGLSRAPRPTPHGFLGLEFAPLTRAAFARAPQLAPHGALIAWVYPLGPADIAGLKPGEIVTKIDGVAVESAEQAADIADAHKAGDKLILTVLDVTAEDSKAQQIALVLLPDRPASTKIYTVRPPRTLAREGDFGPTMAANASWSAKIARGAVKPFPLKLYEAGRCSALAPEGWSIARASPDGAQFALQSHGRHLKALFFSTRLGVGPSDDVMAFISHQIANLVGQPPQLGMPRRLDNDYQIVPFGTFNNYAGFALYAVGEDEGAPSSIALRIVAVPATEVEGLEPLTGAVLLSIHCATMPEIDASLVSAVPKTAISARCVDGHCFEDDLAGAYNEHLHTGYVHSAEGENFLIDPRKDVWAMGPSGSGTYRQIGGTVEKLEPGRTN